MLSIRNQHKLFGYAAFLAVLSAERSCTQLEVGFTGTLEIDPWHTDCLGVSHRLPDPIYGHPSRPGPDRVASTEQAATELGDAWS